MNHESSSLIKNNKGKTPLDVGADSFFQSRFLSRHADMLKLALIEKFPLAKTVIMKNKNIRNVLKEIKNMNSCDLFLSID